MRGAKKKLKLERLQFFDKQANSFADEACVISKASLVVRLFFSVDVCKVKKALCVYISFTVVSEKASFTQLLMV